MGPLSKKRKFVRDGVFYAELYEFLKRELAEDGFAGIEHRVTPQRTEIVIRATKTKEVLGDKARRIRELTSVVQKRFEFPDGGIQLFVERVPIRGLSAIAQAESLRFKLLQQVQVRRACYGIVRYVMEAGAKGIEVIVGGKVKGQRAKNMKFRDGYLCHSGNLQRTFVDKAIRHVYMRAGCLGVRVRIMLPFDEKGEKGPSFPQPDDITIFNPKEDM
jgi:small subunit ribosomal protein S3e